MRTEATRSPGSWLELGVVLLIHLALAAPFVMLEPSLGDALARAPIMAELIQPMQRAEEKTALAAPEQVVRKPSPVRVVKAGPVLAANDETADAQSVATPAARSIDKPIEKPEEKTNDQLDPPSKPASENVSPQAATARVEAVQLAMGGSQSQQHNYLAELMRKLNRHKVYPAELKRDKVEGRVLLKFTISADGQVVFADVKGSSGSRDLDNAAMNMLKRASPLPAIPGWMNRTELTLSIPVEYSLITDR